MLTGALRVGVSQRMVQQALAEMSGVLYCPHRATHAGYVGAQPAFLRDLPAPKPCPATASSHTCLSGPRCWKASWLSFGPIDDWLIEWKWDGIMPNWISPPWRSGAVVARRRTADGRFPEVEAAAHALQVDCVLDGELLARQEDAYRRCRFSALQTRIQRPARPQVAGPKRSGACWPTTCWRKTAPTCATGPRPSAAPCWKRCRNAIPDPRPSLSPTALGSWEAAAESRLESRERDVEGFMLRAAAGYQSGRRRRLVEMEDRSTDHRRQLLYAQSGHGRRSTLYTDYTFGLCKDALVPIAKAYSGLDAREILEPSTAGCAPTRANALRPRAPGEAGAGVFELGFSASTRVQAPQVRRGCALSAHSDGATSPPPRPAQLIR